MKVHRFRGGIKILPFSRELYNLYGLERVFIQKKQGEEPDEYKILGKVFEKDSAVVELYGVTTLDLAQEFTGCLVMVDTSDLLEPEENEYYWFQLIGLEAYTTEGVYIGRVKTLMDRTWQSLLVVEDKKKEFLVPMVDSIIKEISLKDSRITILPIKGLID
ncbi:MAG TPA: ribosome maturation factor RimM [Thermodesulfobacteriota bacterium]|nr:ribosome maturation factor RimM [Thermodesulfobacteriota bacterium]